MIITVTRRCLLCLFFILVTLVVFRVNTSEAAWSIETAVISKYFSYSSSRAIAVDASGNPHIVYGSNNLFYAYYNGSSWHYETIDIVDPSNNISGGCASIALDTSGNVHISYRDKKYDNNSDYKYDLKYVTNASGTWVTTTVDSGGSVGTYISMALDTSGKVHISYYDSTERYNDSMNRDLKYATNASGTWVTTTVDSDGDVGTYASLAIDTSGKVHISYYDDTNDDLKYATNVSGGWVMTTVDSGRDVGEYTSIALDSSSKAHISYYDATNEDIKYATNASGVWVATTVDSGGGGRAYNLPAIDHSGNCHITHYATT